MKDNTSTLIDIIPQCDFCKTKKAKYDGKTVFGPWANMCSRCFQEKGMGLGLGLGQELIERKVTT